MMHFIIIGLCAWIALSASTTIAEDESLTFFEKSVAMVVILMVLSIFACL